MNYKTNCKIPAHLCGLRDLDDHFSYLFSGILQAKEDSVQYLGHIPEELR